MVNDAHPQPEPNVTHQQEAVDSLEDAREDEESFYLFEDDADGKDADGRSSVSPFQLSGTLPPLTSRSAGLTATQAVPIQGKKGKRLLSLPVVAVIVVSVLLSSIALIGFIAFVPKTLKQTIGEHHIVVTSKQTIPAKPQPVSKSPTPNQQTGQNQKSASGVTVPQGTFGDGVPQQLPDGWADANLSLVDGIEANYTAADLFTTREETLDYRSVGTRNHHGGTMTAATYILTPNGKVRFTQNDVRSANNALFDTLVQHKMIQTVQDLHPTLLAVQVQDQQTVVWVDVTFHLWRSQTDDQGDVVTGFDLDPATNQPRLHHMVVLLLRIPPTQQGATPPGGGTGWQVSTYALDTEMPALVEPL